MKKRYLALVCFLVFSFFTRDIFAQTGQEASGMKKGVWVTVFSQKKVLYSQQAVRDLVSFCQKTGISEVYLQIYQGGNAYYDSRISGRSKYEEMLKSAGCDTLDFLLKEAGGKNIKVFAWINILSLGQNRSAQILTKFSDTVLTRDQYMRPSGRIITGEIDKYYLQENQIFLEPGDPRVSQYYLALVDEIIGRYPALSGIHLDYMRYPMTVPFIPGSRFNKYGLDYGFGPRNVERFKEKTGIDPVSGLISEAKYTQWDNWKRQQVTDLARKLSKHIKKHSRGMLVSCAVYPGYDYAYTSLSQDWPLWLEKNIFDYVVLMNYTQDQQLNKEVIQASLGLRGEGKVFVGMGVFQMKSDPLVFWEQYQVASGLQPDGVVFFSYDDINAQMSKYLEKKGN